MKWLILQFFWLFWDVNGSYLFNELLRRNTNISNYIFCFDVSKLIRFHTLNIPEYLTTEMGIFLSSINDMQWIIWSFNHELCILKFELLSAGSDKNHAGFYTWWSTNLVDFDITGRLWWKNK